MMQEKGFDLSRYDVIWNTQSRNAGDSMPLGGHDVGCNVWAEEGKLYLYLAQSGAFDEEGRMCKAGRLCLTFDPPLAEEGFSQHLRLRSGDMTVQGRCGQAFVELLLWAETERSVVHIQMKSDSPVRMGCSWQTWRGENGEAENKDEILHQDGEILVWHRNSRSGMLEERLAEQQIEHLREYFPDVEKNRTFGALLQAPDMVRNGTETGQYGENLYTGFRLVTPGAVQEQTIHIALHTAQTETVWQWNDEIRALARESEAAYPQRRENTLAWWEQYWQRSHVFIKPACSDTQDKDWQCGRNYQLFRYMLGCNAYGEYPTKFNGGLFTVDPIMCRRREGFGSRCPDDRDWGGLIFTAQNQRLVYWPMLRSGDFDMMAPQFEFYRRMLPAMKKRTEHFFGLQDAACFAEQLDANGLSAFYGKYGLDYPLQVRYHHVDAVEFSFMILCWARACGGDLSPYLDLIDAVLSFYDKFYPELDENGKRIIFPSTSLETFHSGKTLSVFGPAGVEAADYDPDHVAVTNPSDVIAALEDTLHALLESGAGTGEQKARWQRLYDQLPPIPTEQRNGYRVIAPCVDTRHDLIANCELPQLYTVFPYQHYALTKPDLEMARNTYYYAWDIPDQLFYISWHQNGIFAARLGLALEARRYMWLKMADATGRRFPAFWGPGHDYVPDHNWGGSGMSGVQEMLLQEIDGKLLVLPAWPRDVDVNFKLWADHNTFVQVHYENGKLDCRVEPAARAKDLVLPDFAE